MLWTGDPYWPFNLDVPRSSRQTKRLNVLEGHIALGNAGWDRYDRTKQSFILVGWNHWFVDANHLLRSTMRHNMALFLVQNELAIFVWCCVYIDLELLKMYPCKPLLPSNNNQPIPPVWLGIFNTQRCVITCSKLEICSFVPNLNGWRFRGLMAVNFNRGQLEDEKTDRNRQILLAHFRTVRFSGAIRAVDSQD